MVGSQTGKLSERDFQPQVLAPELRNDLPSTGSAIALIAQTACVEEMLAGLADYHGDVIRETLARDAPVDRRFRGTGSDWTRTRDRLDHNNAPRPLGFRSIVLAQLATRHAAAQHLLRAVSARRRVDPHSSFNGQAGRVGEAKHLVGVGTYVAKLRGWVS